MDLCKYVDSTPQPQRYILDLADTKASDYPSGIFHVLQKNGVTNCSKYLIQLLVQELPDKLESGERR